MKKNEQLSLSFFLPIIYHFVFSFFIFLFALYFYSAYVFIPQLCTSVVGIDYYACVSRNGLLELKDVK
jgi:uncharacterized membrane protein (DUF106 family)